eukprot:TRINITY_DN3202_c0_g1_i22.p1 TRINITY_DN3202_c0_g1~~TRINITY_DN3202_c0_g1_i22.p1  ORF type:complete len:1793 (-),score=169.60 TRINITY_DN3202_c0_g1_i22:6035-11413(-)
MEVRFPTMESLGGIPRISESELHDMAWKTKNELRSVPNLRYHVIGAEFDSLSKWKKTRAENLITEKKGFDIYTDDNTKRLVIWFANHCFDYGIDFRKLNIPRIFEDTYSLKKSPNVSEIRRKLNDYVILYDRLLHKQAVPIHLMTSDKVWERMFLESLASFFGDARNRIFRSSVIGSNSLFNVMKMSEIDRNSLVMVVPEKVLGFCIYDEIMELSLIIQTNKVCLMEYYKNHSMFDTENPEIYISRLKGLFATRAMERELKNHMEESKSNTVLEIAGVNDIVSYATTGGDAFAKSFAEKAMKGKLISTTDLIKQQIDGSILSAGVGEIDIPVNHIDSKMNESYMENVLNQSHTAFQGLTFANEFELIKKTCHLLLSKYGAFKVDMRFEMIISSMRDLKNEEDAVNEISKYEISSMFDSQITAKEKADKILKIMHKCDLRNNEKVDKILEKALITNRKERREDLEEHRVFKFPPDHMWECRRPEAIDRIFNGFMVAYERWNEKAHDRSGLTVIGVSHIKMNFMPMLSGGCLKDRIVEKIGKCVWVPKSTYRNPVCFWDCIAGALHPDDKMMRKSGNGKSKELVIASNTIRTKAYKAIGEEPKCEMVPLCDIPKFAKALELNIKVYTLVKEGDVMVRKLLVQHDARYPETVMMHLHLEKNEPGHYCLINSLVGYGQSSKDNALVECPRCGKGFGTDIASRYHKHVAKCEAVERGEVKRRFKERDFKKIKSIAHDILGYDILKEVAVYFDLESTLEPCERKDDPSDMREINRHEANGYVIKVWDHKNNCELIEFRRRVVDIHAGRKLVKYLESIEPKITALLEERWNKAYEEKVSKDVAKVILKKQAKAVNKKEGKLSKPRKSIQHDEPSLSRRLGSICYRIKREFLTIPVYTYNGGHYDYNLIIGHLRNRQILNVLSRGSDFLSFDYGGYRFLDCHNYVPQNYNLQAFANAFGRGEVKLVKDIFPYRYVRSFDDLETREWPSIKWFSSKMKGLVTVLPPEPKECEFRTKEQYIEAVAYHEGQKKKLIEFTKDYNERKALFENSCKADPSYNLGTYMLDYCEKDVDLLIAGMVGFAKTCQEAEGIDALKFCTVAQIAFTIFMCNYNKVSIKRVPNEESYDIIEKALYGGNCQMFKPHMVVKEGEIGLELDMTNMYGKAMRMVLPYAIEKGDESVLRNFIRWLMDGDKSFVDRYIHGRLSSEDLLHCGFVRANLSFTHTQQDRMKVFPPLPMKRVIDEKELSSFTLHRLEELMTQDKEVMKSEKLVYDFTPKISYDIYAPALKFLLVSDMVTIDNVVSYLPCKAGYVMAPFIEAMTDRRIKAQRMINEGKMLMKEGNIEEVKKGEELKKKGETLKDFYKLINNSAYGKTIQDDEKFHKTVISTRAVDNAKYLNRYIVNDCKVIAKPSNEYENDEGMCSFSAINPLVTIKAPRHMGAGILWNSKMIMLNFLYNCLLVYCPDTEIYYTDTDSVHIKMKYVPAPKEMVEEVCKKFTVNERSGDVIASLYARFPEDIRKKFFPEDKDDIVAGKMKVDQIFFPGAEGIYLKAKTYIEANAVEDSMKIDKVRDKGVSLRQNADILILSHYREVLYRSKAFKGENEMIRKIQSKTGQYMAGVVQSKWVLDPFNDKRYEVVNEDGTIVTYPYGYYKLEGNKYGNLIYNIQHRIYGFLSKHEPLKPYLHKIKEVRNLTGLDGEGLKNHLECQFVEGMHWGNYGLKHAGWNIDHIIPVSSLKRAIRKDESVNEEELDKILAEVCNYKNLRPMWKAENSAKGGAARAENQKKKEKAMPQQARIVSIP